MWEQLYSIDLGAALGIAYLHQYCYRNILHLDIKAHNILLNPDFTPKVYDFGLEKLCGKGDEHILVMVGRESSSYVPPELCHNALQVLLQINQTSIVSECSCWRLLGEEKTLMCIGAIPVISTFLSGFPICSRMESQGWD